MYLKSKKSHTLTVGSIYWFAEPTINLPGYGTYLLKCNGDTKKRTDFPELFNVIGTRYGEGDGSTTFQLPNLSGRVIQGNYDNKIGDYIEAGLPNIAGSITPSIIKSDGYTYALTTDSQTGCLQYRGDATSRPYFNQAGTKTGSYHIGITFNASNSNVIYGNSTTVQPPSLILCPVIVAKLKQNIQHKVAYCFIRIS